MITFSGDEPFHRHHYHMWKGLTLWRQISQVKEKALPKPSTFTPLFLHQAVNIVEVAFHWRRKWDILLCNFQKHRLLFWFKYSFHYHYHFQLALFFFLRQGLSLNSPGWTWPWTDDPLALASQVLGLQVCATIPSKEILLFKSVTYFTKESESLRDINKSIFRWNDIMFNV
jgi:hypothetical protein